MTAACKTLDVSRNFSACAPQVDKQAPKAGRMTPLVVRFGALPLRDTEYHASCYVLEHDGAKSGYGEALPRSLLTCIVVSSY
jgi:hypothetical protein